MTTITTAWATVLRPPGPPKESQFGGSDRLVTAQVNGAEARIFVPCGEPIERVQPGDNFVVEWRKDRWRYAPTIQPPELLAELNKRIPATPAMPPPVAVAPMHQMPNAPPAPPPPSVGAIPPPTVEPSSRPPDALEWAEIYMAISSQLPSTVDTKAIASGANTVFNARRKP
jgi:hypothetical protein